MSARISGGVRLGLIATATLLSTGCYRHSQIALDQLPELSGVEPGESVLIEKRRGGGDVRHDEQPGDPDSKYRSIRFHEVVVTLSDGRQLKLEAPFYIRVWQDPQGAVVTIQDASGTKSYWLSQAVAAEYAIFDATRPAVIVIAAVLGASLGFALDAALTSGNEGPPDDNYGGPRGLFTFIGLGAGLAVSIPLTSDL